MTKGKMKSIGTTLENKRTHFHTSSPTPPQRKNNSVVEINHSHGDTERPLEAWFQKLKNRMDKNWEMSKEKVN